MRCVAIAEEAISRGVDSIFVGDISGSPWLTEKVEGVGFSRRLSSLEFSRVLDTGSLLFLDSYTIPTSQLEIQKFNWLKVAYICDSETPQYRSDMVINPSFRKRQDFDSLIETLSGPRFFPFRKSICRSETKVMPVAKNIVIVGGGADNFGFAQAIANELKYILDFSRATFYTSSNNGIEGEDFRFRVKEFGTTLDQDIENCDLALSTASTVSTEILVRGVPLGVVSAVSNQEENYDFLTSMGLAAPVGKLVSGKGWEIDSDILRKLVSDSGYRSSLVQENLSGVDLQGSRRIVDALIRISE